MEMCNVAKVAMVQNDQHTLRAFLEAEAYDGPSLIIAYSHCIAHGINMGKNAEPEGCVDSGYCSFSDMILTLPKKVRIRSSLIQKSQSCRLKILLTWKQDLRC